jgi:hypothetical protein
MQHATDPSHLTSPPPCSGQLGEVLNLVPWGGVSLSFRHLRLSGMQGLAGLGEKRRRTLPHVTPTRLRLHRRAKIVQAADCAPTPPPPPLPWQAPHWRRPTSRTLRGTRPTALSGASRPSSPSVACRRPQPSWWPYPGSSCTSAAAEVGPAHCMLPAQLPRHCLHARRSWPPRLAPRRLCRRPGPHRPGRPRLPAADAARAGGAGAGGGAGGAQPGCQPGGGG